MDNFLGPLNSALGFRRNTTSSRDGCNSRARCSELQGSRSARSPLPRDSATRRISVACFGGSSALRQPPGGRLMQQDLGATRVQIASRRSKPIQLSFCRVLPEPGLGSCPDNRGGYRENLPFFDDRHPLLRPRRVATSAEPGLTGSWVGSFNGVQVEMAVEPGPFGYQNGQPRTLQGPRFVKTTLHIDFDTEMKGLAAGTWSTDRFKTEIRLRTDQPRRCLELRRCRRPRQRRGYIGNQDQGVLLG